MKGDACGKAGRIRSAEQRPIAVIKVYCQIEIRCVIWIGSVQVNITRSGKVGRSSTSSHAISIYISSMAAGVEGKTNASDCDRAEREVVDVKPGFDRVELTWGSTRDRKCSGRVRIIALWIRLIRKSVVADNRS